MNELKRQLRLQTEHAAVLAAKAKGDAAAAAEESTASVYRHLLATV